MILFIILAIIYPHCALAVEEDALGEIKHEFLVIQKEYTEDVMDHQRRLMADLENKLNQQIWQTNVIAGMVLFMVLIGLWLSYLQFRRDEKTDSKSSFSLKIGSGTLEVSSSVIGLAILALSFWFFQTYVSEVYNVNIFEIPFVDAIGRPK